MHCFTLFDPICESGGERARFSLALSQHGTYRLTDKLKVLVARVHGLGERIDLVLRPRITFGEMISMQRSTLLDVVSGAVEQSSESAFQIAVVLVQEHVDELDRVERWRVTRREEARICST